MKEKNIHLIKKLGVIVVANNRYGGIKMILVKINKTVTLDELEELVALAKFQETNDRYEDTKLHINGDKAEIDVKIYSKGDIELL